MTKLKNDINQRIEIYMFLINQLNNIIKNGYYLLRIDIEIIDMIID